MEQQIILASGSQQRKMIMEAIGLPFVIIPADIDEKVIRDEDVTIRAEKIARAKAEKVAAEHEGVVIAADTFVVIEGKVLEKPTSKAEAIEMLRFQSGKPFATLNGFCYIDTRNDINVSKVIQVQLAFRELHEAEIRAYVEKFPVTTWAGAFSPAYPYGMTMIATVNGSFTGFMHGLPMDELIPLLQKSGFNVHP